MDTTRRFTHAVSAQLDAALGHDWPQSAITRCCDRLATATCDIAEHAQRRHAPAYLAALFHRALNDARATTPSVRPVLETMLPLLAHADWMKREAAPGEDCHFVERHRHALLLGPRTPIACTSLLLGVAILEPQVTYPFHEHPPEEFYLVFSPGRWYQEGRGWWQPGSGAVVHNPPGVRHAMAAGDQPLLALWGLLL
ncbi:dimethylsulfonioproprionate lyase family protein [Pseudomonas sp. RP23018S]|uniref:dimethylsulfonioproprionate lyase family protein n=1 Tax=Pseudomonas sp. RP23018S TaxID=3096037 RepID=UPI002ACC080F|nr:dimethylsulfonioproprionate lyase family protein [Pseudomonas sp. RP23018S]